MPRINNVPRTDRIHSNRVANVALGLESPNEQNKEPKCSLNYINLIENPSLISDYTKHFDWWLFPCITNTYENFNYNIYDQSKKNSVINFFYNLTRNLKTKTETYLANKLENTNNTNNEKQVIELLVETDIRIAVIAKAIPELLKNPYNIRLGKILQHLDFTLQSLKKKSPKLFNTYKQIVKEHIINKNPTLERHLNKYFTSFRLQPYKNNYNNLLNICYKETRRRNNNGNARLYNQNYNRNLNYNNH